MCNKYTNAANGGLYGDTPVQQETCTSSDDLCVTWTSEQAIGFNGTFGQCISGAGCELVNEGNKGLATVTFCGACNTDSCNQIIKYGSNAALTKKGINGSNVSGNSDAALREYKLVSIVAIMGTVAFLV